MPSLRWRNASHSSTMAWELGLQTRMKFSPCPNTWRQNGSWQNRSSPSRVTFNGFNAAPLSASQRLAALSSQSCFCAPSCASAYLGLADLACWSSNSWRARVSGAAQRALARCDLILAVTDNDLSRTLALQLALEHGREYLQAGTDITLAEDGAIIGLRAEVTGAEIGRYCPICSGRLSPGQASIEARAYAGGEVAARALSDGYLPDVAAPAVMSLNAVTAGLLVTEIQRRTAGIGVRDLLQLDLQSGALLARERLSIGADCQVCGAMGAAPTVAA